MRATYRKKAEITKNQAGWHGEEASLAKANTLHVARLQSRAAIWLIATFENRIKGGIAIIETLACEYCERNNLTLRVTSPLGGT